MKTLKKFSLGKKKVSIQLSNIYFQNQNIFIFGHPLNIDTKKISEKYLMKNLKKFLGYFFIIIKKKRSLILITDVTANKRVSTNGNGTHSNEQDLVDKQSLTPRFEKYSDKS